MGREESAASAWMRASVLLVVALLLSGSLSALSLVDPVVAGTVGLLLMAAVAVALWRSTPADESESVWDVIPSWQYSGRHVESGGLTRDEQERALRDVQREADERDRRP